ncbi:mitochondrial carrier protein LEU5 [Rhexocercosporidium sp. MPI-PUGE-AT-0058]|nr:mitochondrial carrier protein LEU5 [Rhexocercosporidium sp. MPI-PUGE-AT-0058]
MPSALINNASPPAMLKDKSQEMDAEAHKKGLAICPTDDDAIAPKGKKPHKQSLDYIWRTGVAGGLAGSAAKTLVAPLDRVKILFQASNPQFAKYTGSWFGVVTAMKDIYKDEGACGLFRGHSATILRIFPYAAIKFLAYEQIRSVVIHSPAQETPIRRLLSGSMAGVTSVFFTYPLEVIRVRLAFETKRDSRSSLSDICKRIYNEAPPPTKPITAVPAAVSDAVMAVAPRAGLANFYRGFSATVLGMLPYAGMSFLTHDTAGDILRYPMFAAYTTLPKPTNSPPNKPPPLRSWAELFAGGIAGLVSQTSAYPLEVIRRRMQVGGAVGDGRRLNIGETAKLIVRERGVMGFWIGLSIGYVKVVPMVAVSFYVYERGKTWLGI